MNENNLLAIFFALLSALTIAWGTVIRHRVASTSEDNDVPLLNAVRSPWWWGGLLGAMAGYGLQIVALNFGTLLIVQPILVLSLMFTLPLSARMDGRRISKAETTWAFLLTVAVAVLVVLGRPTSGDPHPPLKIWLLVLGIGVVVIGAILLFAATRGKEMQALLYGAMTGAIMGYLALMSKAVVDTFRLRGMEGLVTGWELYALLALAGIGTAVQQLSFNGGALKNSLPAMTIVEPLVAFSLGYAVLGERFQVTTSVGWFSMGVALTVMIGATVALSRMSVTEKVN